MNVLDVDDVTERMKRFEGRVRHGAHQAWLAGLGAVALVEEETRGFFDTLVTRGEGLEARGKREVERAVREMERTRERVTRNVEVLGNQVDRRFAGVLHRLGVPTRKEIHELTRRVEALTGRVVSTAATPAVAPAAPAAEHTVRVVWSTDDEQWRVETEGATRATSLHPTKDQAVAAARELAREQAPSVVVVQRRDGTVQNRFPYDEAPH
ncbi:MAG TPA: phasin family protein [Thermoanaerobaculia bacterium]|nr:phasin family protein [Thermoanaerobaculia bacterium]